MDMADRRETTINTSNGLNPNVSAPLYRQPSYEPVYNKKFEPMKPSGSKAYDPILVLDDDEPDAAEINYIDLENDNEALAKEIYTAPIKQALAEAQDLGFQSVAKNHGPHNDTQEPDPAMHTKNVTHSLFRALTKDDFPAPSVQAVPENRATGFKAWYRTHDSHHTGNTVRGMQHNATSRNPSIALYNEKRTKNMTRKDRDAPQVEMSVLNSKRKRTIGELGYDELISPAQIESPSEKLARMAKKRRQRQERCDLLLHTTNAGDAQGATDFDHAYGHEDHRMTRESVELADSPIMHEPLHRKDTVAGLGDERSGPSVVRGLSPVKPYLSDEGHENALTTQHDHSLEGVANRAVLMNKKKQTDVVATQVHSVQKRLPSSNVPIGRQIVPTNPPIDRQTGALSPIASTTTPLQDSNIQAPNFSGLPEVRPATKDQAISSGSELKLDDQRSLVKDLVEHRNTAGKGLSKETLRIFQETGDWHRRIEGDQNADEVQDEETEVPNIAYHYFVQKREWLETEEDAIETNLGPYHTMNEANAVAKAEVQSPQIDGFEGIRSKGWSYLYRQDEYGMQTHMATVLEVHMETVVHRELAPPRKQAAIPKSAFIVTPRVYIVHELQWLPSSPDATITAPTHCQSLTHGVFTLLNKANQRASAEYLETLTGNWEQSEYDLLKKLEMKSDLDKKVRALNREIDYFQEEIKLDNNRFAKVWVEMVVVEGPRN